MRRSSILIFLSTLFSGCSLSSLNPFSSSPIGYIQGDDITSYSSSDSSSKKFTPKGKISKARFKATMKPYCVNGKTYCPTYVSVGDTMTGIASWYGPNFHGLQTSSGEQYNMYDLTVAHKTWPMNTMVKITNLDNGKSVIARVNDRGPFVAGRIVDCSYAVAKKLGIDKRGTCNAKLEVVGFAGKVYHASSGKPKPKVLLTDFGVQVGAFKNLANAMAAKAKYIKLAGAGKRAVIRKVPRDDLEHVQIFGFKTEQEAKDFIAKQAIPGAFIVRN